MGSGVRLPAAPRLPPLAAALLAAACAGTPSPREGGLGLVEDAGFGDPGNVGVGSLLAREEALYVGTWNTRRGCGVFRSRDGRTFSRLGEAGFGSPRNFCALSLAWHEGHLYVGTWNVREGGELHRIAGGRPDSAWECVTRRGFGNPNNLAVTSLCSFRGFLYAGCYNQAEGPEVWRSRDGAPGTWSKASRNGWGDPGNSDATSMLAHEGWLYVGTETLRVPGRGCQVWRTGGRLHPPFDGWEQVAAGGFGEAENINVRGLAIHRGMLCASTWNVEHGIEVWGALPSAVAPFRWERLAGGGFGDARYHLSSNPEVLDDVLYVGAFGRFRLEGNPFEAGVRALEGTGGLLMATGDGTRWRRIDRDGFLRFPQLGVSSLAAFRGRLFIGGMAQDRPLQLWVLDPGGQGGAAPRQPP